MGAIRGVPPKRAEDRIRRNKYNEVGLIPINGARPVMPAPKEEWAQSVKDEWEIYWNSPLAQLADAQSDLGALFRLFDYKHEQKWAMTAYKQERITGGSKGQQRSSPMFEVVNKLERLISPLEDRFGMTPYGRLRLGATLGEASKSLADLNAQVDNQIAGSDDDDDDPRAILDTVTAD